ncbi:alanyl-tRNA editing protein [Jingyaoa shaoxingensis]|uniref:Alanyl-tRNA editing protein n=1 Tax=Jingyaoa shaoxingensis TaxID=2763671 RepID=A0ABR7N869_9FIRM|nr:alanine--tRNA ligase-related protein [Jingyaoa shaoxingensis]MBC8572571.1 alanyl-tRNA editing protein [Jingyaoa shaoxingensis]
MTEKLFYKDVYQKTFEATITDCREGKNGYEIILDRTAFYPEGGGQPGDTGYLQIGDQKVEITDTHEKDGEILHFCGQPLEVGSKVTGTIDWNRRFGLMQNHSGEHIVSGLVHSKFGYDNVGFHMGKDTVTIDFNGEFTVEDMWEFEKAANERVWANEKVDITSYTEEEAKSVEYRSKKELHGMVRVVTFPNADVCACCGTHVSYTGEIGLIKLISLQKFKGGMRMEMLSGRKAMEYVEEICRQNQQISVALSAKPLETAQAVEHLKKTQMDQQFHMGALEQKLFQNMAKQYEGSGSVLIFEEGLAADSVRKLAAEIMETCEGRCVVCSGDDESGYKYAMGEKDGDLRALVKEFNSTLNGRGGGKPFFAQGSVSATRKEIEEFLK